MAVKTQFSKEDFEEILAKYDLGRLVSFEPISAGTVQTNFLLTTEKGGFVFRYYENRSLESAVFEADLTKYLSDKNYPCPAPLENKQRSLVDMFNEKPYVIYEFMEGSHIQNPTEEQKKELIKEVAELQTLTDGYKPQNTEYQWNYTIDFCREQVKKEAEKLGTENAKEKLEWYQSELSNIELPQTLPKGICHCDFHFSNVLFKDGKFNALIDFDDANYTYLTLD